MITRRDFVQIAAAAGAATVLARGSALAASSPLQWKHFPAGENDFFRAPVLLFGAKVAKGEMKWG